MKNSNQLKLIKHLPATLIFLFLFQLQALKAQEQFANGADIGWLSQMENQGYVFKNSSGIQMNCMDILKEKGINALRFRVWVNPAGGYCNKQDVLYMAHRADSMGFDIMINFHLSDTWADPGHQTKPAAWVTHTLTQLNSDVYGHVYDVLVTLKSLGIIPKWVQIGNETNDGALYETGKASTNMSNFASIIKSGYNAVKAVDSSIQVIVHLSNGHDNQMFRWMFDGLRNNGAKWDIIGMSVYPYWANLPWQTDDSLALITMEDMIARYNTKVMVVEAGYLYYKPVEANQYLLDLIEKTKSVGGLGVFYWEPQSYNWQGYQLGAWNPATKQPTAAMDAFLGISAVSVDENNHIPGSYGIKIYPNPFNPSATIEYELPKSSDVSIVIYDILGNEIATLADGFENTGSHTITWQPQNVSSGVYFCRMKAGNFFETKKIMLLK
ncbi:MAG: glycosyl hydrolase 53 family protein [Ignavibacteria bacterium]